MRTLGPKGVLKGEVRQERMLGDGAVLKKMSGRRADFSVDLSRDGVSLGHTAVSWVRVVAWRWWEGIGFQMYFEWRTSRSCDGPNVRRIKGGSMGLF